jgi:nitroimidazol reductase NimA-like FMN-containing flavoprotein (pyridoxamine 5'-phosphate oxidase superfamily)
VSGRPGPVFRQLERAECEAILARNRVGRVAFTFHDRVDIEPIHYAYRDAWIHCRTSVGTKLTTIAHHRWVAFEVDEFEGGSLFDWSSVVVHGAAYLMSPEGTPEERQAYERALALLRELLPRTLAADDPVPWRGVLLRIHADEITGRAAEPGGAEPARKR